MFSSSRQGSRSWLGDIFGFDPLTLMRSPDAFGTAVERTEDGYRLEMPVAGFRPEDINITVEERQLVVEGRGERRRFTRAIVLPDEIDAEKIDARVDHGLLTLMLPLNQKMQPRRIAVHVGGEQKSISDQGQGATMPGGTVPTVSGETQERGARETTEQPR